MIDWTETGITRLKILMATELTKMSLIKAFSGATISRRFWKNGAPLRMSPVSFHKFNIVVSLRDQHMEADRRIDLSEKWWWSRKMAVEIDHTAVGKKYIWNSKNIL
jgi:hypothetical protein